MSIIEDLRTPNKLGKHLLLPSFIPGEFDSHGVDCPFLYLHEDRYFMTYVGFDGVGYRTGLASSEDLLNWTKEGIVLDRGAPGSATEHNAAMACIMRENELSSPGLLRTVQGRYVGTYHAYPEPGYEMGPAAIGICYSDDLRCWEVLPPVLYAKDGAEWEAGGLYKSWLMEHEGTYYLFYNAKRAEPWPWHEAIGVAMSSDLERWERHPGNPILRNGPASDFDARFCGEALVLRHPDAWVMFYFGYDTNCEHMQDSAAISHDLLNWEKTGELLVPVGAPGSLDSIHAHKPGIITADERLYHFYCGVAPAQPGETGAVETNEMRGITVAWS